MVAALRWPVLLWNPASADLKHLKTLHLLTGSRYCHRVKHASYTLAMSSSCKCATPAEFDSHGDLQVSYAYATPMMLSGPILPILVWDWWDLLTMPACLIAEASSVQMLGEVDRQSLFRARLPSADFLPVKWVCRGRGGGGGGSAAGSAALCVLADLSLRMHSLSMFATELPVC